MAPVEGCFQPFPVFRRSKYANYAHPTGSMECLQNFGFSNKICGKMLLVPDPKVNEESS
jgi:hypothetical protein